jgi:hypothetical protein
MVAPARCFDLSETHVCTMWEQSEENSAEEEDHIGQKRKAPLSEEERKKRRQEINRQSARRIRERRSVEMEDLRQKVLPLFCVV